MYRVRGQIGCRDTVQAGGGKNITIAVLDTGVAKHPDIVDRILAFKDFTKGKEETYDDSGHGTHVCGIACGDGALSSGRYRGIAPKAGLVVGKVLDDKGDGALDSMLNGINWVLQNMDEYHIRILNVSVGIGGQMNVDKESILKKKLESAWQRGLLVVCAAGNNGPECESLSRIGRSPSLITVGCNDGSFFIEKNNRCASYSARGGKFDTIRKPDIVAPGTEIISCNGKFKVSKNNYHNAYIAKSGTSMATPIVSGALALLLQKHPEYDNETAKRKLLYAADDLKEPWYQQGWGMINIARMMEG
ncbi:MAG TPA: S8 family peptidase [Lachnospiraceae bacterium]|nr:S8 family peptidase [Lachnospiraceae bacterium]